MKKKYTQKTRGSIEITELNEEAKDYSLNASLTKSFSLNSIDDLLFGKNSNISSKSLYEMDVEVLLEGLSIKVHSEEYLGPKAIIQALWNRFANGSITVPLIVKFLDKKKGLRPYTFLKLLEVSSDLNELVRQKHQTEKIIREHLLNLHIYEELIQNSSQPSFVRNVLYEFYTKFVNPFKPTEDADKLFKKEKRDVLEFHHPECEKYLKHLLKERITEITKPSYHFKFKRFFTWLVTVVEEFKRYDLNNIPIYKIRNDHLADYKRYLLVQVKNGSRPINGASDDLYIIKDFFKHLYQNKRILQDVTKEIGIIKQKNYHYRDLPCRDEIIQFFEIIEVYAEDPIKEGLAFGLLFNNGLRINELAHLKWEHVNLSRNTISLTRKGNKPCIIYIPTVLRDKIKKLYKIRGNQTYIFNERPETFKRIINENYKVYGKLTGWNFPNGVHIFRHIFITYLTEKKCSPGALKELANVENPETLSYYIHRSDLALTDEINKIDFTF